MESTGRPAKRPRLSRRSALAATAAVAAGGIGLVAARRQSIEPDEQQPPNASASKLPEGVGVAFAVSGREFAPSVSLKPESNAEIIWRSDKGDELARGANPDIEFGSDGERTVILETALDDVTVLNLGFNSADDPGEFSLPPDFNRAPVQVTAISGLTRLSSLRRLMAANTPTQGHLDISGLAHLEHLELFGAQLQSVDFTGCSSLIRLCVEQNALTALDLNPVAGSLRDLRAAAQSSQELRLQPLDGALTRLAHFCVRGQRVSEHPTGAQLPACEELWNWGSAQSGECPVPGSALSVLAAGNSYRSADFEGQWQGDTWGILDLTDNQLESIKLSGCRALQAIRLSGNRLSSTAVDALLQEVASWGTSGTELLIGGSNASPSDSGLVQASLLEDRGWKVDLAAS